MLVAEPTLANLRQSDAAPSPLSAGMAAEAVSEALAKAREDGPWSKSYA